MWSKPGSHLDMRQRNWRRTGSPKCRVLCERHRAKRWPRRGARAACRSRIVARRSGPRDPSRVALAAYAEERESAVGFGGRFDRRLGCGTIWKRMR